MSVNPLWKLIAESMRSGDKLRVERDGLRFKCNPMRYAEVEIAAEREGER